MDEKMLFETVQKMVASGLSDQAIFNTLLDVGIPKQQALSLIDKVRNGATQPSAGKPQSKPTNSKSAQSNQSTRENDEGNADENPDGLQSMPNDEPTELGGPSDSEEQPADSGDSIREPVFNEEETHEKIAERTAKKIKQHLEERDLVGTTGAVSLEEHGEKLDEMHEKVDKLHQKMDSLNAKTGASPEVSKKISALSRQVQSIQNEIKSIKQSNAETQALLKRFVQSQQSFLKTVKKKK